MRSVADPSHQSHGSWHGTAQHSSDCSASIQPTACSHSHTCAQPFPSPKDTFDLARLYVHEYQTSNIVYKLSRPASSRSKVSQQRRTQTPSYTMSSCCCISQPRVPPPLPELQYLLMESHLRASQLFVRPSMPSSLASVSIALWRHASWRTQHTHTHTHKFFLEKGSTRV